MCFLSQVVSNEEQNLTVTSEKTISVEGHEGMLFDGKMFHFEAEEDVDISSTLVTRHYLIVLIAYTHCGDHFINFIFNSFVTNYLVLFFFLPQNKEIIFDAAKGVYLDGAVRVTPTGSPVVSANRFKLCACLNTGKLYRVAVNSTFSTCATIETLCQ